MQKQLTANNLFCIQDTPGKDEVFGKIPHIDDYAMIDVRLLPCASTKADEQSCVWEKEKIFDYLTDAWIAKVFYNQAKFK